MRFGIFYEHQLPRPWDKDSEYRLLHQSLDQIELADRLGYHYAWEVEHHFLEEYSHSSAPEVFLGAASQRTQNIRLGHGIIQLTTNHPARVAERVSTLDLLSHGRVEFGMGEASSTTELHPRAARYYARPRPARPIESISTPTVSRSWSITTPGRRNGRTDPESISIA